MITASIVLGLLVTGILVRIVIARIRAEERTKRRRGACGAPRLLGFFPHFPLNLSKPFPLLMDSISRGGSLYL